MNERNSMREEPLVLSYSATADSGPSSQRANVPLLHV